MASPQVMEIKVCFFTTIPFDVNSLSQLEDVAGGLLITPAAGHPALAGNSSAGQPTKAAPEELPRQHEQLTGEIGVAVADQVQALDGGHEGHEDDASDIRDTIITALEETDLEDEAGVVQVQVLNGGHGGNEDYVPNTPSTIVTGLEERDSDFEDEEDFAPRTPFQTPPPLTPGLAPIHTPGPAVFRSPSVDSGYASPVENELLVPGSPEQLGVFNSQHSAPWRAQNRWVLEGHDEGRGWPICRGTPLGLRGVQTSLLDELPGIPEADFLPPIPPKSEPITPRLPVYRFPSPDAVGSPAPRSPPPVSPHIDHSDPEDEGVNHLRQSEDKMSQLGEVLLGHVVEMVPTISSPRSDLTEAMVELAALKCRASAKALESLACVYESQLKAMKKGREGNGGFTMVDKDRENIQDAGVGKGKQVSANVSDPKGKGKAREECVFDNNITRCVSSGL